MGPWNRVLINYRSSTLLRNSCPFLDFRDLLQSPEETAYDSIKYHMNQIHTIALFNVIQLSIHDFWLPDQNSVYRCHRSHVCYVLFIFWFYHPKHMLKKLNTWRSHSGLLYIDLLLLNLFSDFSRFSRILSPFKPTSLSFELLKRFA